MSESLLPLLTKLRLSGLAASLEIRLHEAATSGLTHREFLELILQDELMTRDDRKANRRITAASFRDQRRLEDFDFSFNTSIKKNVIFELATCRFVREKRDALFLGPPGTGKSHLVQGLGLAAIRCGFTVYYRSIFDTVRDFLHDEAMEGHERVLQKYLRPDLLIIDDMGMKQLPKRSGEYLFEIIMRRHELRSTMMTSNRPLEEWGKLIGDVPAATAILDRFLHHAELVQITGRSYRLEKGSKLQRVPKRPPAPMPKKSKPKDTSRKGCSINDPNWYPMRRPALVPFQVLNDTEESAICRPTGRSLGGAPDPRARRRSGQVALGSSVFEQEVFSRRNEPS